MEKKRTHIQKTWMGRERLTTHNSNKPLSVTVICLFLLVDAPFLDDDEKKKMV